jgi:hypothetical protein
VSQPSSAAPELCRLFLRRDARHRHVTLYPNGGGGDEVAEVVKTTLPDYPRNVNFGCLDFLGSLSDFLTVPRMRSAGCICEGQRELWRQVNAATTFAGLSDE